MAIKNVFAETQQLKEQIDNLSVDQVQALAAQVAQGDAMIKRGLVDRVMHRSTRRRECQEH